MQKDWNSFLRDVVSGEWRDPTTGLRCPVPFKTVDIRDSLDGGAADLVAPLNIGRRLAVISDQNTVDALGRRVAKELKGWTSVDEFVLPAHTHCDEQTIALLRDKTRHCEGCVVVGSGALTDTVKYATFKDGRKFASFATAGSMNGYSAASASVTLENGYKTTLPAHAAQGIFVDLGVCAAAPAHLAAAGLADSLCRVTAQVEWWTSHRLFGTSYMQTPFDLFNVAHDEAEMIRTAPHLKHHDVEANGFLFRVLMLAGFGNNIVGTSHSGSMGEHQVSHWIDMFAGASHPGSTHGQQVGVATLALARLHKLLLSFDTPPRITPKAIQEADFAMHYGDDIGRTMFMEAQKKHLVGAAVEAFNRRAEAIWPELKNELAGMLMEPDVLAETIKSAGGPTTATELGLSRDIWRKAMKHARDVRNRWSFLDLADDAGLLDDFLAEDPQ